MVLDEWSDHHMTEIDRLQKLWDQAESPEQREAIEALIRAENSRWQDHAYDC